MKRIRWMLLGAVAGTIAYRWAMGRARETVRDSVPQAGNDALRVAREAVDEARLRLREAFSEGRQAAGSREQQLRRELLDD